MKLRYGNAEEVGMCSERLERLDELINEWIEEDYTPAVATFVARKGVVVHHKAFGVQTPEEHKPQLQPDTIFPVASISKPVVATAIMMLNEQGRLSILDPVNEYLPELTGEGKENICIYHLLTHSSGMRDCDVKEYFHENKDNIEVPLCDENQDPEAYKYFYIGCKTPMWNKPGEEMSYFNYGYGMLGEIIRRVSGESLNDFTRKRIFEPLGMKDSYFSLPDELLNRAVRRRKDFQAGEWFTKDECFKHPGAAGGLCTTVEDLGIFGQMFLNKGIYNGKRILSPLSVNAMTMDHVPGIPSRFGDEVFKQSIWGLGWNVAGNKKDGAGFLRSPKTFSHSGAGGTDFLVDPVNEVVAVKFTVCRQKNNVADHKWRYLNEIIMGSIIEE